MTEREPDFSRIERKKGRKRTNRTLNILIAVVVLLIVITASTIFLGNNNEKQADEKEVVNTETNDKPSENDNKTEDATKEDDENKSESSTDTESGESEEPTASGDEENSGDSSEESGTVTYGPSDDKIIAETVVNTAWEPIGTTQTGDHASQYDGKSVDWNEKKKALAYATGLSENEMLFLKIKNGGGPQKSIGIVSSKDKSEKYRVYLEWVDGQGWKPVKMDKLTTLEFDY